MKLAAALDNYYVLSGILSTVNRQLCFAGIAVVWIFAVSSGGAISLPQTLHWPLLFLVMALGFDLFHYAIATLSWGIFHRHHEKRSPNPDRYLTVPPWINWPAITLSFLKVVSNLVGLIGLLLFIWGRLS